MALKDQLPQMNFFLEKQLTKFYVPISPFHSVKFKKNSQSRFRVMRMYHFRAQNGSIVLNKIFFGTNHYFYFHLPAGPFHCSKFLKKFIQRIQSYEDGSFLGPKWSICP